MKAHWIYIEKFKYKCSACGHIFETTYPIDGWKNCCACNADMTEDEDNAEV